MAEPETDGKPRLSEEQKAAPSLERTSPSASALHPPQTSVRPGALSEEQKNLIDRYVTSRLDQERNRSEKLMTRAGVVLSAIAAVVIGLIGWSVTTIINGYKEQVDQTIKSVTITAEGSARKK